ncbi:MAG: porin family protein [Gemmatimonadetes bacterium]|nr:porin family protein [Gemmatimonadota bacterium]
MNRWFRLLAGVALLSLAASPVLAQRAQQIEIGVFGSFIRYDQAFLLKNRFGGGARVGYFLSDRVGIELDGGFGSTQDVNSTQDASVSLGSASLVLNFPMGERTTVYALGGYSRLVFGDAPPYDFTDNGVHGAVGARYFLTNHWAIRAEGRAIYSPSTNFPGGTWGGQVVGSVGASYFYVPPQQGGGFNKHYQWYWGAQGGALIYKTNVQSAVYDPMIGGHWLITAKRTALYVAYEQAALLTDAPAAIVDPASSTSSVGAGFRDVTFSSVRRIMVGLLAFPSQKVIEPFAGGGFALMQVLNPVVDCSSCVTLSEAFEAQSRAEDAASKAFFWAMGGFQINYSTKLNVFGQYVWTSSSQGFLLEGPTHTLQGGIRYSLGTSKEGLAERN